VEEGPLRRCVLSFDVSAPPPGLPAVGDALLALRDIPAKELAGGGRCSVRSTRARRDIPAKELAWERDNA